MADDNKRKLISFLERKVWNPVLRASGSERSDAERKKLERVQRKTESQKQRYGGYENAGEVRLEFQRDLRSRAAKSTDNDLNSLGLPTQPKVADEFFALADRMGVGAEESRRRRQPRRRRESAGAMSVGRAAARRKKASKSARGAATRKKRPSRGRKSPAH